MQRKGLRMGRSFTACGLLRLVALALTGLLLAACANPERAERKAQRLALFEEAAGKPIKSFHFWNMDRFETLSRTRVVIWTRPNKAFVLDVEEPCVGLEFAHALGVSSTQNRVHNRFDSVFFDDQRCRIRQIREVDLTFIREWKEHGDGSRTR